MKISRDFSPLKRLQRLGSTCPDERMGRTQTFYKPNQGTWNCHLQNARTEEPQAGNWNVTTLAHPARNAPMSPVIPLHKRTPCISCLENAGWHLSTVRNGSPCKQCLYCLQSSRSYAQTGKVHQPLCRQDINRSAFFLCLCAQFCDVSHANSSCTIRPSVSCRNRSSGCIWVDDSVDLVHLVHLVHLHTALLRRFTASPRPGKPGKCTSHLEDVTTVTTVTPFVKFYSRALS